ncbi:MAG: DUF2784 domain-containing protein [Betaproteobacteria bacterium]|nr:DUF2784 domain-containing protein [Betaproteobacteria bacterium]
MVYSLLADLVLLLHLAFIVLVLLGGLAVWRWPRLGWLHVPAAAWGVWVELTHGLCPLTPLENALRRQAGEAGVEGDFITHYLSALIYPQGLSQELQTWFGLAALALNLSVYGALLWQGRRKRKPSGHPDRPEYRR